LAEGRTQYSSGRKVVLGPDLQTEVCQKKGAGDAELIYFYEKHIGVLKGVGEPGGIHKG